MTDVKLVGDVILTLKSDTGPGAEKQYINKLLTTGFLVIYQIFINSIVLVDSFNYEYLSYCLELFQC